MAGKATLDGELMFPNEFLSAIEFKGRDVTLTIRDVQFLDLPMRGGAKKRRPVLLFKETYDKAQRTGEPEKKLVCNVTNTETIADNLGYGWEGRKWVGKQITLYPTTCRMGKDPKCPCIRVRPSNPRRAGAESPPHLRDAADVFDESDQGAGQREPGNEG